MHREAVDASSLVVFKARIDGALNNLVQREVSQPIAEGLELHDFKGTFQPQTFYNSIPYSNQIFICSIPLTYE